MDSEHINKMYAVVKFISDSTYSEIPTAWLTRKNEKHLCYWPPRTANAATLIANRTSPNMETWCEYEVDVIKYCSSLESARRNASDASYYTTDEENLGRGKRIHTSYNPYSTDEDSENYVQQTVRNKKRVCTTKISTIPSCPENFNLPNIANSNESYDKNGNNYYVVPSESYSNKSKNSNIELVEMQEHDIVNMPILFQDCSQLTEKNQVEKDLNTKNYLKQILHMQASSQLMLQEMAERLKRLEGIMKNHSFSSINISDTLIANLLPMDTIEAIQTFDVLIKNTEEALAQFKQFLQKTGGNNPKDNIHRALAKTFTNSCAMKCSWKGIRNNFKVSDLYFIKIMRREITSQHKTLTETEFDNIVAEWLRFAKQRMKRNEKGKENMENNCDKNIEENIENNIDEQI